MHAKPKLTASDVIRLLDLRPHPEGGHYTRVTVETNQPGESELDRRAKRFLAEVHADAEPGHVVRGAY